MGQITIDQSHQVIATLMQNADWGSIDFELSNLQEMVVRNPQKAGAQFTAFLKNGGRVIVGESILKIDRSKPFDPTFIGPGWTIWRGPADGKGLEGEEEQDVRSLALTEINLNQILLEAHLKQGESSTTGEERINRLNVANRIKLDAKIFQTLWENRDRLPERFKQKTEGNTTFIFCDGTTLRSPSGDRYSLYFYWDSDGYEWSWGCRWRGRDRRVDDPSASLASQS